MGKKRGAKKLAQKKYELVDRTTQEGKAAYALFDKVRKAYHDHTRDAKAA
jgi:hypothetical protein